MTESQIITALFAAPFLALGVGFLTGLAAIELHERRAVRKLKSMLREDMQ